MHHDRHVQEEQKKKSDIMLFYNKPKSGVDVCDKMCKQYSVRSMVSRWPQVHFQNMLDVVGANTFSQVCLNAVGIGANSRRQGRRNFLYSLSKELVLPFIHLRIERPSGLSNSIIRAMVRLANRPHQIRAQRLPLKDSAARSVALRGK